MLLPYIVYQMLADVIAICLWFISKKPLVWLFLGSLVVFVADVVTTFIHWHVVPCGVTPFKLTPMGGNITSTTKAITSAYCIVAITSATGNNISQSKT